jgi:hypothetical protein
MARGYICWCLSAAQNYGAQTISAFLASGLYRNPPIHIEMLVFLLVRRDFKLNRWLDLESPSVKVVADTPTIRWTQFVGLCVGMQPVASSNLRDIRGRAYSRCILTNPPHWQPTGLYAQRNPAL